MPFSYTPFILLCYPRMEAGREEVSDMDVQDKRDDLKKKADELRHEQDIEAAKADIELKKQAAKEARDVAKQAAVQDRGGVSIADAGPEAVRTETIAKQAEDDLAQAEQRLKDLQENKQSPEPAKPASTTNARYAKPVESTK